MISDKYKTLESEAISIFRDKGSKFIAYGYPLADEAEVKIIVDKLRKEHHSARHWCFAWRLGIDGKRYRANDDGEPSGSAGRPILGQLLSYEVTDILVVVVRYFGGTLLGVPGLINAYKSSTSMVLEEGNIVERTIQSIIKIKFDYIVMNSVMKIIKDHNLKMVDSLYDNLCTITLSVDLSKSDLVRSYLEKVESLVFEEE